MSARPRAAGFTLIELIVFIVVVSVGLAGVLAVFDVVARHSADPLVTKKALAVADAQLEEILLKNFANPAGGWSGAATVANRPNFDDVGDFNGYASTGAYSLTDTTAPIAGLEAYNVAVTVAAPAAAIAGVAAADIRQVTVTVSYGAESYVLTGYRFNHD